MIVSEAPRNVQAIQAPVHVAYETSTAEDGNPDAQCVVPDHGWYVVPDIQLIAASPPPAKKAKMTASTLRDKAKDFSHRQSKKKKAVHKDR